MERLKGGVYMTESFTTALNTVTSGMGNVVEMITGSPLLMLPVLVGFVGAMISLAKRLLRFGGGRRR